MRLRSILINAISLLALLTLAFSVSLVTMGSYLRHVASDFERSTESVSLIQEIELALISYDQATDPVARASLQASVLGGLRAAQKFVDTPEEQSELDRAHENVRAYLARSSVDQQDPARSPAKVTPELTPALLALRDLANENVKQTRDVLTTATRWDRRADFLATGLGLTVLIGVSAILVWLRFSAFQPIFAIESAMRRFGAGEGEARAPERGSAELRTIARSFNALTEELSRRQKEQLTFLAGVAHDLRNPVSVLKMASALIPPDQPLPSEDRVRQMLARVERQVSRLDRMLGDFLDAARIQSGVLEIRVEEGDARTILHNVFDLFHAISPAHRLSLSLPQEPLLLRCDPMRVEQVLNNLVSNAIKYSPEGGQVRLSLTSDREDVVFSVSDEGIGISREEVSRLFVPFRRGGMAKEWISGVGLGLCVAKRITEAHGGSLEVESAPGRGSTFQVRLPRSLARLQTP